MDELKFKVGDRVEVRKDTPHTTAFIDETFPFMAKVVESRPHSLLVEAEESRKAWAVYPEMLTLASEGYTPQIGDQVTVRISPVEGDYDIRGEKFPFEAEILTEASKGDYLVKSMSSEKSWYVTRDMVHPLDPGDEYTPRVGDKVRRTFKNGTVVEGKIRWTRKEAAEDGLGFMLWTASAPDETELLERPIEFKSEPGTVYGHPNLEGLRVVRVGPDDEFPWLGEKALGEGGRGWFPEWEVEKMVREEGWVEFDLEGNRVE